VLNQRIQGYFSLLRIIHRSELCIGFHHAASRDEAAKKLISIHSPLANPPPRLICFVSMIEPVMLWCCSVQCSFKDRVSNGRANMGAACHFVFVLSTCGTVYDTIPPIKNKQSRGIRPI
jgi:hypothetical protein